MGWPGRAVARVRRRCSRTSPRSGRQRWQGPWFDPEKAQDEGRRSRRDSCADVSPVTAADSKDDAREPAAARDAHQGRRRANIRPSGQTVLGVARAGRGRRRLERRRRPEAGRSRSPSAAPAETSAPPREDRSGRSTLSRSICRGRDRGSRALRRREKPSLAATQTGPRSRRGDTGPRAHRRRRASAWHGTARVTSRSSNGPSASHRNAASHERPYQSLKRID